MDCSLEKAKVAMVLTIVLSIFGILMAPAEATLEDLFQGEVELQNNVKLKGEQYWQSQTGDSRGFAYYGYKYGQAKRFQDSVLNRNFSYLQDSDRPKLGYVCSQASPVISSANKDKTRMDEDCLYLDIYLPPIKADQEETWPVLFWIHGGAFKMGNKDNFNGSVLAQAVDAIVVTVNYRLAIFGFLSSGDETASGNWSIGDLKLALNWTFTNIATFNGDPAKITIAGESAGGVLTSALMLDDHVRGKVLTAVAMSGSILRPWAITKNPAGGTRLLAAGLACPTETSTAMMDCLKAQSVDQLLNASQDMLEKDAWINMYYAPVIDGKHIPKAPLEILRDRHQLVDVLTQARTATFVTGFLTEDASTFVLYDAPELLDATLNLTTTTKILTEFWKSSANPCPENIPFHVKLIVDQYNLSESDSPELLRQKFFRVATDSLFGLGSMEESAAYANSTKNNYMYIISYNLGFDNLGAFHGMDTAHLFPSLNSDSQLADKISEPLTKSLQAYFGQLAHYGRLSQPYFEDGNYEELNQEAEWQTKHKDFLPLIKFWKGLEEMPCSVRSSAKPQRVLSLKALSFFLTIMLLSVFG